MFKVFALVTIFAAVQCQNQVFLQGSPARLNQFRSLKSMIQSCQKKFLCKITSTATSDSVECVDAKRRCDGHNDCSNNRDEAGCPTTCAGKVICPDRHTCATPCDGVSQCPGHEDEKGCAKRCPANQLLCEDKKTCAVTCDHVEQCPDGRDEMNCATKCPYDQMQCNDKKQCGRKCDGIKDCPGGEDETTCPFSCRCPPGNYLCAAEDKCISRTQLCNEVSNECTGNDDDTPCA